MHSQVLRSNRVRSPFQVVPSTKENGETNSAKASEDKNGQTAADTRVTGSTIRPMASENYSMPTETYTRASGRTIRPMARELTLTQTGLAIREIGETTSSMALVSKLGLTVPFTKASTLRAKRTAKESLPSQMDRFTTVISK